MKGSALSILTACAALLLLSSCEKKKGGIIDPVIAPPYVTSLTSRESALDLDTTFSAAVKRLGNGHYELSDSISTVVSDANGRADIKAVYYRLYLPNSTDYILSGALQLTGITPGTDSARYSSTFSFTVTRADVGTFRIEVYAVNRAGSISNSIQLPLAVTRKKSRPRLSGLVVPDTIVRPASGSRLFLFSVVASDSDGYGDIAGVFFKRIYPSATISFPMLDDGGKDPTSGDQLAGDGTFSRIVRIDQTAFIGTQVFLFQARNKLGELSDSLTHAITIIQ